MVPHLRAGRIDAAVTAGVEQIGEVIAGRDGAGQADHAGARAAAASTMPWWRAWLAWFCSSSSFPFILSSCSASSFPRRRPVPASGPRGPRAAAIAIELVASTARRAAPPAARPPPTASPAAAARRAAAAHREAGERACCALRSRAPRARPGRALALAPPRRPRRPFRRSPAAWSTTPACSARERAASSPASLPSWKRRPRVSWWSSPSSRCRGTRSRITACASAAPGRSARRARTTACC